MIRREIQWESNFRDKKIFLLSQSKGSILENIIGKLFTRNYWEEEIFYLWMLLYPLNSRIILVKILHLHFPNPLFHKLFLVCFLNWSNKYLLITPATQPSLNGGVYITPSFTQKTLAIVASQITLMYIQDKAIIQFISFAIELPLHKAGN